MTKTSIKSIAAALALTVSAGAHALPITGDINFGGDWTPWDGLTALDSSNFTDADRITFEDVTVGTATESFSGTEGTAATFDQLVLDPFAAVEPLWSFTFGGEDYSFDLLSMNYHFNTSPNQLTVWGSGVMRIGDSNNDNYSWTFTGNVGGSTFTFSAVNYSVPEPAMLALLGGGLLCLALLRMRRRREVAWSAA